MGVRRSRDRNTQARYCRTKNNWCRIIAAFISLATASVTHATELSGILIYACAPTSGAYECDPDATSIAWHTAADDIAAPIAVLQSLPPRSFALPVLNPTVDLAYPLTMGKNVLTLVWQPAPGGFPPRLGLNVFFNGDLLLPGIAAHIPVWAGLGFTSFLASQSATTYSMYLREVENPATLAYSDGQLLIQLTAFLATPPALFAAVDLVGLNGFGADRRLDAVAIIELSVTPAIAPAGAHQPPGAGPLSGLPVGPPVVVIGAPYDETPLPITPVPQTTPEATPAAPLTPATAGETATAGATTETPKRTPAAATISTTETPGPNGTPSAAHTELPLTPTEAL